MGGYLAGLISGYGQHIHEQNLLQQKNEHESRKSLADMYERLGQQAELEGEVDHASRLHSMAFQVRNTPLDKKLDKSLMDTRTALLGPPKQPKQAAPQGQPVQMPATTLPPPPDAASLPEPPGPGGAEAAGPGAGAPPTPAPLGGAAPVKLMPGLPPPSSGFVIPGASLPPPPGEEALSPAQQGLVTGPDGQWHQSPMGTPEQRAWRETQHFKARYGEEQKAREKERVAVEKAKREEMFAHGQRIIDYLESHGEKLDPFVKAEALHGTKLTRPAGAAGEKEFIGIPAGGLYEKSTGQVISPSPAAKEPHIPSAAQQQLDVAARVVANKMGITLDEGKPLLPQLPPKLQDMAMRVHKQQNESPDLAGLRSMTIELRKLEVDRLRAERGPEAVAGWVNSMKTNPDIYHEAPATLKPILANAWTQETGKPPPKKLAGESMRAEETSGVALMHIAMVRELVQDPVIQQRLGPLLGRVGNAEQTLGTTVGLSQQDAQKVQQFRTALEYFKLREGRAMMSGRPAVEMMKIFEKATANPQKDLPMVMGALDGAESAARATIQSTYEMRFGVPGGAQLPPPPGATRVRKPLADIFKK